MPARDACRIVAARWVLLLLPCLVVGVAANEPAEEPLTNERVVLLVVSGKPLGELIQLIQESPVDFDLSAEMVDELRAAGLPGPLIEAMRTRQAEIERARNPAPEATPAEEPAARPALRILLDDGDPSAKDAPTIRLFQGVDPALAEALGLRDEVPTFTDLAIFLGCLTADHVPDHWRSKTPLGRDFRLTPRHKLLSFLPGAEQVKAPARMQRKGQPALAVLELAIPDHIEVELEPELAHDLVLGVAVQTGERYYLVVADERIGLVLQDDGGELRATISDAGSLSAGSLEVHFRH